jgi:hypothetical protein
LAGHLKLGIEAGNDLGEYLILQQDCGFGPNALPLAFWKTFEL